jgi:hypothetical protein
VKAEGLDYGGIYTLGAAQLVIINPELIGEITIKKFDKFVNRLVFVDQK